MSNFSSASRSEQGGGRKGRGQRLYGRGRREAEAEAEDDEQWPRPHRPFPPEFAGIQEAFTELYQMLAVILNMSSNVPEWARQAAENHPPPEQAAHAEPAVPRQQDEDLSDHQNQNYRQAPTSQKDRMHRVHSPDLKIYKSVSLSQKKNILCDKENKFCALCIQKCKNANFSKSEKYASYTACHANSYKCI